MIKLILPPYFQNYECKITDIKKRFIKYLRMMDWVISEEIPRFLDNDQLHDRIWIVKWNFSSLQFTFR